MEEAITELVLHQHKAVLELDGLEAQRAVLLHMVGQATTRVDLISRDLDRRLFDHLELVTAFRRLALRSRHSRVRLIVMDCAALARQEHRLMHLIKRLPSYFHIRAPHRDHERFNASVVLVDGTGYIYRPQGDRYTGQACFNDLVKAGELTRRFDQIWETGQPDVNLRQMTL